MRWDPRALEFDREAWDAVHPQARRRHPAGRYPASLEDARRAWEPVVCPHCGLRHSDTRTVRLRRAGRTVEARCAACGAIAAVYAEGVWSS